MKSKILFTSFLGVLFAITFTGCATSVSYQTTRLPAWNTAGIKSIAVVPFEITEDTALQRHAAVWLNSTAYSQIQSANHFTMYSPANAASADAVFTGKVYYAVVNDSIQTETRIDQKTKIETDYIIYERIVQLAFIYTLTDKSGIIIGTNTIEDSFTNTFEVKAEEEEDNTRQSRRQRDKNQADLRINEYLLSPEAIVQDIINKNLRYLTRNMIPYTVTEKRNLMKDPSKNKAVKQQEKEALSLANNKKYKAAQDAFNEIYLETKSYETAYNVCLLMMAQRQYNEALLFMQSVLNVTGDTRAAAEINNIQRIIDNENLAASYSN